VLASASIQVAGASLCPMLTAKPKTKRHLEAIQFLLTFVSTCAVLDTARIHAAPNEPAGYHAGVPRGGEAERDRTFGDLARSERRRRESELKEALEKR